MSRPKPTPKLRRTVQDRANGYCEYCYSRQDYSPDPFVLEHIEPIARGGVTEVTNLCFACGGCNGAKGESIVGIDPLSTREVPLFHPRQHAWKDHFVWSADNLTIIGRTDIGRATIAKLKMNRLGLINLRRILLIVGEHPPK